MNTKDIFKTMATALAVAFVVYSCKGSLSEAEKLDLNVTPIQVVEDMFFVQTENGVLKTRVEAPRLEVYEQDSLSFDLFPQGVHFFGYAEDGSVETTIVSGKARHDKRIGGKDKDIWSVFDHVVIRNVIKQETMETDTLYWDQEAKEIWTDCYIKLTSPSGLLQGYGMRSDEMARNAILLSPFDNEFVVEQDSTVVVIDSVNFIGPMLKK